MRFFLDEILFLVRQVLQGSSSSTTAITEVCCVDREREKEKMSEAPPTVVYEGFMTKRAVSLLICFVFNDFD